MIEKLGGLGAELRLAAVVAALPVAEGDEAAALAGLAVELSQLVEEHGWAERVQRGWAQLVGKQDVTEIRAGARRALMRSGWKGSAELHAVVARMVAEEWAHEGALMDDAEVEGLLRLAERSGCGVLGPGLARLVMGGEAGVARRAAAQMLVMAEQGEGDGEAQFYGEFRRGLAVASEKFEEHRIGSVLVAALHVLTPRVRRESGTDELRVWFTKMMREPSAALVTVLRSKPDAVITMRAWEWMRFGALAQVCAERCGRMMGQELLQPLTWAVHPCRQRAVLRGASVCERIGMGGDVGWSASCLADRKDADVAAAMVQSMEPRGLLRLAMDGDAAACLDVALVGSSATAEVAAEKLGERLGESLAVVGEGQTWGMLARSANAGVRRHASIGLAWRGDWVGAGKTQGVDWREWMDAACIGMRMTLGLQEGTGERQWREMGDRIEVGEEREVMLALQMVKRLGGAERVQDAVRRRLEIELGRIAVGDARGDSRVDSRVDSRLAAMLVQVLGGMRIRAESGAEMQGVVERALGCVDARVRSNAIETVYRWKRRGMVDVEIDVAALVGDQANRPRATAVRELVRMGADEEVGERVSMARISMAIDESLKLLTDHRPAHRLSGTWATERVLAAVGSDGAMGRWGEVCDRLVEVADRDVEGVVRRRAHAATQRLRAEIWVRSRRDAVVRAGAEDAR